MKNLTYFGFLFFTILVFALSSCQNDPTLEEVNNGPEWKYYRLVQVDFDGTSTEYEPKAAPRNSRTMGGSYYPSNLDCYTYTENVTVIDESFMKVHQAENGSQVIYSPTFNFTSGDKVYFTDDVIQGSGMQMNIYLQNAEGTKMNFGGSYYQQQWNENWGEHEFTVYASGEYFLVVEYQIHNSNETEINVGDFHVDYQADVFELDVCSGMPITLVSFDIFEDRIEFITMEEVNSNYVEIQGSNDAKNWTALDQIPSESNDMGGQTKYVWKF